MLFLELPLIEQSLFLNHRTLIEVELDLILTLFMFKLEKFLRKERLISILLLMVQKYQIYQTYYRFNK